MVQRTEVQGMQALAPAASRPAQVIQRAVQTPVVDVESSKRVSGILAGLAELTDASSQAAFKQAQIDVETKKIDGMATAVSGGQLGANATKAEEMGYDVVQSQSELGKINEDLANKIAANPEMSDEEFKSLKNEQYAGLLSKYQDKAPEVFKAISVKAQESQIALYGVQQEQKKRYQKQKGVETLNYNIGANLDSIKSPEQGQAYIHQIMGQGAAMGLSEFETKDQILEQMKLSASQGDARLLQAVQGTDWGRYTSESKQAKSLYDAHVKQAKTEYEAAVQKQNAFAYGKGLAEVETLAKTGAPQAIIEQKLRTLQGMGMKLSPSSIASYLTMGKDLSEAQLKLQKNITTWNNDKGNYNLATNPNIAAEDKTKVLNAMEGAIDAEANNQPEETRGDWTIQQKVTLSQQEGMPVKSIGVALTSLASIDPQQPMTPAVSSWTKMLLTADDQTIRMNVPSDKDQKFLFNMRDSILANQGQSTDKVLPMAIARAQSARDNVTPLSSQQVQQSRSKATSSVGDLRDPTQNTWYFRSSKLPKNTQDFVTNQIDADTKRLANTFGSIDRANEIAVKDFKKNNIILSDGVIGNAGVEKIAAFNPALAQKGDSSELVQKRAVSALDSQVDEVVKAQSKADGIDYQRDQVNLVFSNRGDTYQVMVGGLWTGTYYTKDLTTRYSEDTFKKWSAEQDKQQGISETFHQIKEANDLPPTVNPFPKY
ncbi:MAG: hypothetical protein [Caudoviricetes sp.]|nr:MAG: hypothetical protein [Caudoviricetes sp.]